MKEYGTNANNTIGIGWFSYRTDMYIIQNAPIGPIEKIKTNSAVSNGLGGTEEFVTIQNARPLIVSPRRTHPINFILISPLLPADLIRPLYLFTLIRVDPNLDP